MKNKKSSKDNDVLPIETVACKNAGKKLYQELTDQGINLTGHGVTLSKDKKSAAIYIMLRYKKDEKSVPSTWGTFEVVTRVTGNIVAQ